MTDVLFLASSEYEAIEVLMTLTHAFDRVADSLLDLTLELTTKVLEEFMDVSLTQDFYSNCLPNTEALDQDNRDPSTENTNSISVSGAPKEILIEEAPRKVTVLSDNTTGLKSEKFGEDEELFLEVKQWIII